MELLKSGSYLNLDKNKKNILFLMFNKNKSKSLEKSYGCYHILYDKLKTQFNIVIVSDVGVPTINEFVINKSYFKNNNNPHLLYECFDKIFNNVEFLYAFNCGEFKLSLGKYSKDQYLKETYNEFFDYVNDSVNKDEIKKSIEKLESKFYKYVALSAFSTVRNSLAFLLNDYFNSKASKIYNVVIDPSFSYTEHFNKKPHLLYFTDDFRGSRQYHKFDIPQFQMIYQNTLQKTQAIKKSKLFIWYGSLFYNKGTKKDIYDLYLKDIKHDMDFYCPLNVNSWRNNDNKDNVEKLIKNNFYELFISIKNHKNYKGYINNEDLIDTISKYKYGLITRCISICDSLNFRPIYYSYLDILPFFDYKYDPEYLYIPKNIQDKLVVKNAEDIDKLLDYYENNDNERIKLLNELKNLFKFNEYINDTENTINKEIKRIIPEFKETFEYFNEINEW